MTHQLPHDVAALVELAASHAEGHQPLFEGHLESVASLYQVHPERLERAREAFTAPHFHRLACELADASPASLTVRSTRARLRRTRSSWRWRRWPPPP